MKKYFKYVIILLSLLLFAILTNKVKADSDINYIRVDIKGAISNPGVYKIEEDSIINDLIIKAGGLREDASTSYINLAQILNDGDVVIVYTNYEIDKITNGNIINISYTSCKCPSIESVGCINKIEHSETIVNLNTATKDELMKLSGIGESKAQAIINYRLKQQFTKIEELMNIKGIGEKMFDKIKDSITV